ncbi:MAG TPA: protein kinase [Pyrinomonadaceae bacterium]|nr:protein kinase [Pyrinomonadaceae bacterium]
MSETISPNTTLAHYTVLCKIGAGGMGEVYRARDEKLNRDVAIKVLPSEFAKDEERLVRFKREAQVLASLNHPNIAAIYGLEDFDGAVALVMEFIDGSTLADRLERGPIAFEDAHAIAKQIADALEAAHERGIVHRDLKPANVKVTPEGIVKVLDFGLAKILEGESGVTDLSHSPTLIKGTQAGVILGTAAYMSPEQAKGKVVDKRSDVWAFGCVLFEMLTGRQSFIGETLTDILAAVVRAEPDWNSLPQETPREIRRLLIRCLSKDPRQRLRDIGEARIAIEESLQYKADEPAGVPAAMPQRPRVRTWQVAIAVAALTIAISSLVMLKLARQGFLVPDVKANSAGTYVVASIGVNEPSLVYLTDRFAVAPDGSSIVFVKQGEGLFTRKRNQIVETLLPGSPKDAYAPAFSPDGKWIAFSSENSLKKIPAGGGAPEVLSRTTDYVVNLTWGSDDVIRFPSKDWDAIRYVSSKGGQLQSLSINKGTKVSRAEWLPGNKLLVSLTDSEGDYVGIRETDGSISRMFEGADAKLTPTNDVLYAKRDGSKWSLMTRSFDPGSPTISGDETLVAQNIAMRYATPAAATAAGDVFFVSGEVKSDRRIVILFRDGSERVLEGAGGPWQELRLSPDGSRLALSRWDGARRTIWTLALETRALTQVTYLDDVFGPVWVGLSNEMLVTQFPRNPGMEGTTMWRVATDGSGGIKPLFQHPESYASSTSQDGRIVYYTSYELNDAAGDLFTLDLSQSPARRTTLLATPADEDHPLPSPNAKWLAYTTNASGSNQVRLTSLGSTKNSTQITMRGGTAIRWTKDSSKLYYRDGDAISVIDLAADGPRLQSRKTAFPLPGDTGTSADVFPDGEKAIVVRGGLMYSDLIVVQGFLPHR